VSIDFVWGEFSDGISRDLVHRREKILYSQELSGGEYQSEPLLKIEELKDEMGIRRGFNFLRGGERPQRPFCLVVLPRDHSKSPKMYTSVQCATVFILFFTWNIAEASVSASGKIAEKLVRTSYAFQPFDNDISGVRASASVSDSGSAGKIAAIRTSFAFQPFDNDISGVRASANKGPTLASAFHGLARSRNLLTKVVSRKVGTNINDVSLKNKCLAVAIPGNGLAEQVFVGGFGNFLQVYNLVITARILLSWFPQAQGVAVLQPVFAITDPYLNLFRGILPSLGGLDFSPILAFVTLNFATGATASLGCEM